jgi:hypothetical protein
MSRGIGVGLAIFTAVLAIWWMTSSASWLYQTLGFSEFNLQIPVSQAEGPRVDSYNRSLFVYYQLLTLAPIVAVGGIAYLLVVEWTFEKRVAVYLAVLAIILPLNLFNYKQGDIVLAANFQAFLNLLTIFLGLVVIAFIWNFPVTAIDAQIARLIVIVILLATTVLVPAFFTALWAMVALGIIGKDAANQVTMQHITAAAGIVSTVTAVLKFVYDIRKDQRTMNAR